MSDQVNDIVALTQQLSSDNLALWSDEKRKSFTDTFDSRVRVSRYILIQTAVRVASKAKGKHFISDKHLKGLDITASHQSLLDDQGNRYSSSYSVGGRPTNELNTIAEQHADEIISKLPSLNEAVRIISPEVSKMIEQKVKLLAQGKKLMEDADKFAGVLDMDDLDPNMTISAFQAMVKDREKKRIAILNKLDEIGNEGNLLESKINKFLYDGLPGLSAAVIQVIKDYVERATAFSGLNRRVAEQVQFGDSEAALEMLKSFEKDEVKVSTDIQSQFDGALEILKMSAKKGLASSKVKKLSASKKG